MSKVMMTVLIPRNTTVPTRKAEIFSTAEDNQTQATYALTQQLQQTQAQGQPQPASADEDVVEGSFEEM